MPENRQMDNRKGAVTLAEGHPDYRTHANIAFGNVFLKKDYILRTTLDDMTVWKTKHRVNMAGFKDKTVSPQKWAARIEKDYWVFGVDATKPQDIVAAVKIGVISYGVRAADLLSDIYVKNLNAEDEKGYARDALIRDNQKLYEKVANAVVQASKLLGVQGIVNFHVFSNSVNHKIPKANLHMALKDAGAESVETDSNRYTMSVGSNDGKRVFEDMVTHMHLAKFRV